MAHQRRRGGGRFFNRDAHNLRPFQDTESIDPHFLTSKKFVHAKAFTEESMRGMHEGDLVYLPSCAPLDMDRVKKSVVNYYRVHKFDPNLDYLYECQHNIQKKYEKAMKLQDAFNAIVMDAFARKFEAIHEKYKDVLDANTSTDLEP